MFTDPPDPLASKLRRLDLLLHREILILRATYQLSLDEFRGLYISDEQVDRFLDEAIGSGGETPITQRLTEQAEALHRESTERAVPHLPWARLAAEFGLSPVEQDLLLLAVAPEIELKYETLYAYLNNDITRKWPTHHLALRLFARSPATRAAVREVLLPQAPLFRDGLLRPVQPVPERPSWLALGFAPAPAVTQFLLGGADLGLPAAACVTPVRTDGKEEEFLISPEQVQRLRRVVPLLRHPCAGRPTPVLLMEGHAGTGRRTAAASLCRELGVDLLHVDLEAALASPETLPALSRELVLRQRLLGTGLYLEPGEALLATGARPPAEGLQLLSTLAGGPGPLFLACAPGAAWRELLAGRRRVVFSFPEPDGDARRQLWETALARAASSVAPGEIEALAHRFILTPGQICDAVTAAVDQRALDGSPPHDLPFELLVEAARAQSGHGLEKLAQRVRVGHGWDDLVLPPATLRRVKEIAAAIRHRHVVYGRWGFGRRLGTGTGLKALFAGASGTGKSMTAGVIARDLGLELYKIDLSGVVSKYIGETEKNLEAIFRAARGSNAILFFDEADALFGKRSEVKDAHDRYANIEIAYLLQRVEEHEGAVILASNLSKNIDEAFARRMHYVVEFPMPDETQREQLWRGMFPSEVPLDPEVDCSFLARQFSLAGGDIRNVALDAAFLAAADGQIITMQHLVQAMARQILKQGRLPSPTDFKQYHALVGQWD